jgi:hypothetical protein
LLCYNLDDTVIDKIQAIGTRWIKFLDKPLGGKTPSDRMSFAKPFNFPLVWLGVCSGQAS